MNISEFRERFQETSLPLLEQGFVFEGGRWILCTESYNLVYSAESDKFGRTAQIRHLSVGMCHSGIERFIAESEAYSNRAANICVLNISPDRLELFSKSLIKRFAWQFVVHRAAPGYFDQCVHRVYYGGADKQGLKDKNAPKADHQRALLNSLARHGIKNLEEQHCIDELRDAAKRVAAHSRNWADSISPKKTLRYLRQYEKEWWYAREWVSLYEAAAQAGYLSLK